MTHLGVALLFSIYFCLFNWKAKLGDPSLCQMAKWSCLLLECLRKTELNKTRLQILSSLREEGVCCCLQPASVINMIVPLIPNMASAALRNYALETLNIMLLTQFQGNSSLLRFNQLYYLYVSMNMTEIFFLTCMTVPVNIL